MRIVNDNIFSGWILSEIETLRKFKFHLRLMKNVHLLHNWNWLNAKTTVEGKVS